MKTTRVIVFGAQAGLEAKEALAALKRQCDLANQTGAAASCYPAVTHDGAFHADELAALCMEALVNNSNVLVLRTRDAETLGLAKADPTILVLDCGGELTPLAQNFDHHHDSSLPSAFGLYCEWVVANSHENKAALFASAGCPLSDQTMLNAAWGKFTQFVAAIDDWDCNRNGAHAAAAALPGWRNVSQIVAGFNRFPSAPAVQAAQFEAAAAFMMSVITNELYAAAQFGKDAPNYAGRQILPNNVAVFAAFSSTWRERADHDFAVMPAPKPGQWQVLARDTDTRRLPVVEAHAQPAGLIFAHPNGFNAVFDSAEAAIAWAETL